MNGGAAGGTRPGLKPEARESPFTKPTDDKKPRYC